MHLGPWSCLGPSATSHILTRSIGAVFFLSSHLSCLRLPYPSTCLTLVLVGLLVSCRAPRLPDAGSEVLYPDGTSRGGPSSPSVAFVWCCRTRYCLWTVCIRCLLGQGRLFVQLCNLARYLPEEAGNLQRTALNLRLRLLSLLSLAGVLSRLYLDSG